MGFDSGGLRRLSADLGRLSARTVPAASAIVRKTAFAIEATAKANAPVDTGALRNSISTDHRALSAEVGPTVEYAIWVEGGTSRMAPQPFLGPAVDRHEPQFLAALGKLVDGVL
jgi:HK97 gp10 family phage protein